jgi:hypothetical protein
MERGMSNFHTGSRFVVVAHPEGIMTKRDIIRTYTGVIAQMDHNQPQREIDDIINLNTLPDSNYFMCIRQRTGPQSEYESVVLSEYGIKGRCDITWQSDFIIWDQNFARATSEFIVAGGFTGEKKEVTECLQP